MPTKTNTNKPWPIWPQAATKPTVTHNTRTHMSMLHYHKHILAVTLSSDNDRVCSFPNASIGVTVAVIVSPVTTVKYTACIAPYKAASEALSAPVPVMATPPVKLYVLKLAVVAPGVMVITTLMSTAEEGPIGNTTAA